jgi:hypothetical protein
MKLIQPNCRAQFAAEDIDFIQSVFSKVPGGGGCLVQLLGDEESRDTILDDELILRALLERGGCLKVSSRFYFYILVRHTLKRAGVLDRTVADYVAEMLAEFGRADRAQCRLPGQAQALDYFFEMVNALTAADPRSAFEIRVHMGNYALFLSGVFPERIQSRAETRGFPGLSYYSRIGQTQFRLASDHHLARRYCLDGVFSTLSERFDTTRAALNDIAERLFSLGEASTELERALDSLAKRDLN